MAEKKAPTARGATLANIHRIKSEVRADLLHEVRTRVFAVPSYEWQGDATEPRNIQHYRCDILNVIDKLADKEKADG